MSLKESIGIFDLLSDVIRIDCFLLDDCRRKTPSKSVDALKLCFRGLSPGLLVIDAEPYSCLNL